MNKKAWGDAITFPKERIEEYHEKILDETIEWEDKEPYYVKMQEDIRVLEKLLGQVGEKVVIKTKVEW